VTERSNPFSRLISDPNRVLFEPVYSVVKDRRFHDFSALEQILQSTICSPLESRKIVTLCGSIWILRGRKALLLPEIISDHAFAQEAAAKDTDAEGQKEK
jgi:hypothetical protein